MTSATAKPETARLAGGGGALKSGKRDEPNRSELISEKEVEKILAEFGMRQTGPGAGETLESILRKDFETEKKKAADEKSYKSFKPLVVVVHDGLKKLFEGLGYTDGPGGKKDFDFGKADGGKVIPAVASLAEAIYKKEDIRDRFIEAVRGFVNGRIRAAGAAGVRGVGGDVAGKDGNDPAAVARRKELEDRIDAYVAIPIALVKIFATLYPVIRGEEEKPPTTPEETWEKRVKPVFSAAVDLGIAAVKLLGSREGGSKLLKGFSTALRKDEKALQAKEEEVESRVDAALGLSVEEQKKRFAERQKKRDEREKKLKAETDGATAGGELKKVLSGVATVLDNGMKAWTAFQTAFPSDLSGEWDVEGHADGEHLTWKVKLEKAGEGKYAGTATVRGLAPVEASRRAGHGSTSWIDEARAEIEMSQPPGATEVTLSWKSKPKQKLRTSLDADDKSKSGHVSLAFVSARELVGKHALSFCQWTVPKGTAPARLVRPLSAGRVLQVILGAMKTIASIPAMLPTRYEKDVELFIRKKTGVLLGKLAELPGAKFVKEHFVCEWNDGKPRFGLKAATGKTLTASVAAQWDIMPILDHLQEKPRPKGSRSPWMPIALEGHVKIPKIPGAISLTWESWNSAEDKKAGTQGIEDKFDGWLECKQAFDEYLGDLGAKYDILTPEFTVGDFEPALRIPLVVYLGKYKYTDAVGEGVVIDMDAKITLRLVITAKSALSLVPQLRAALFAWDMGWTIGTFIRSQLLKTQAWRDAEKEAQNTINYAIDSTIGYQEACNREVAAGTLFSQRLITFQELLLAQSKVNLKVWQDLKRHGAPGLEGDVPRDWSPAYYTMVRESLEKRLAAIRERTKAPGKVAPGFDRREIETEAEAIVFLHLWGSDGHTREEALAKIAEAEERKHLHPARCEVLRAYLDWRDPSGPELLARHASRVTDIKVNTPETLKVPVGSEVEKRIETVSNPVWIEADLASKLLSAQGAVSYLNVVTHPVRVRHLAVEKDGAKTRVLFFWDKPGVDLRVYFGNDCFGPDDKLLSWTITSGKEPHDFEREEEGLIWNLTRWMAEKRIAEKTFKLYAKVKCPDGDWESPRWGVTIVNDRGFPQNAGSVEKVERA